MPATTACQKASSCCRTLPCCPSAYFQVSWTFFLTLCLFSLALYSGYSKIASILFCNIIKEGFFFSFVSNQERSQLRYNVFIWLVELVHRFEILNLCVTWCMLLVKTLKFLCRKGWSFFLFQECELLIVLYWLNKSNIVVMLAMWWSLAEMRMHRRLILDILYFVWLILSIDLRH